MKIHLL